MPDDSALITVFRSADSFAEDEAAAVCELLSENGVTARLATDAEPGVVTGTCEVRVAAADLTRAEQVLATRTRPEGDPGPDLDLTPIFQATGTMAEMEAISIHTVLQSAGIDAVLIGSAALPTLPFEIRVARHDAERARAAIAEARAAGPEAAEEAAAESQANGDAG